MRTRTLLTAIVLVLSAAGSAAAASTSSRLGTPEILTTFAGESTVIAASSAPGHGDAYAVVHRVVGKNLHTVTFADDRGVLHRFQIADSPGTFFPYAVRLVPLEDGGGMAIWDQSSTDRLLARRWSRTGELGPEETVLTGVSLVRGGDVDSAKWILREDGRGTVVVATTGLLPDARSAVLAAVRDPGGDFAPQQRLDQDVTAAEFSDREIALSEITSDGSVLASWSAHPNGSPAGAALRTGRKASFGGSAPATFVLPAPSTRGGRALVGPDGGTIALSARLARRCPCLRPQVFAWPSGEQVLAFQRYDGRTRFSRSWSVARGDGRGGFDRVARATIRASAFPVRRPRSGEVGFASFDTETDYQLFRTRSRLTVVPFGPRVARSRRAPRVQIGTAAPSDGEYVKVPISCDRVCTLTVRDERGRRLPLRGFAGPELSARVEPFTVVYARAHVGRKPDRLRVRVLARDDARHRARASATFRRGTGLDDWKRILAVAE